MKVNGVWRTAHFAEVNNGFAYHHHIKGNLGAVVIAELYAIIVLVLVFVTLYRLALTVVSAEIIQPYIEFVIKIVR